MVVVGGGRADLRVIHIDNTATKSLDLDHDHRAVQTSPQASMSVFFSDTHTCHHLIEHAWNLRSRHMTVYLNTCLAGRRQRLSHANF